MNKQETELNLESIQKVWLIGIKGTGMTPVAQILKRLNKEVSGSDVTEVFFTDEVLERYDIPVHESFDAKHITKDIDLVIYSIAYDDKNPEVQAAREQGIPMLSLAEALAWLFNNKTGIAIAGTHGKTTTTALLGYILQQADYDPTVVVGAPVPQFDGSALVGGSEYFVLEADEYHNKFSKYDPMGLLLTNIEYDHPDSFPSTQDVVAAFTHFAKKVPPFGFIVANVDDVNVQKITSVVQTEVITYGSVPSAAWRIEQDPAYKGTKAQGFVIYHNNNLWSRGETNLVGMFNLLNILAACVASVKLNLPQDKILAAIKRFRAPKRRFEFKGMTKKGAKVVDDFAHHPTELQVTLKALRNQYPDQNITAVFHPHTFTRTQALFDEFARSFKEVDAVVILDIYGSAREQQGTVTTEQLVEAINVHSNNATHIPTKEEAYSYLESKLTAHDIVITMGAGDVWKLADQLVAKHD